MDTWYIYIIETKNKKLYTGITKDVEARFQKHLEGGGAKFFRTDPPSKVVYTERVESKSSALKREIAIKKLSKTKKLELIKD